MEVSEYERYGRQMIVPEVGLKGQLALKTAKFLVVGAGGLGCPAIAYLAGSGVGQLGIVDPDRVETSNLHRQILHTTVGMYKAESAANYVAKLNPLVKLRIWTEALTPENAIDIVSQFDVVLDCTDSPMSRYLVNDAAVLCDKPVVSASALKTEGQLAVYHYKTSGPCYRCLFPTPPPPELVGSCGDNGIIGPVVGIMGVHQAIEALKVVMNADITPSLTIFSMFSFPQWRQVRIRLRKPDCSVCGDHPTITSLKSYDYSSFCGVATNHQFGGKRVSANDLAEIIESQSAQIVDVRPRTQFEMCALPNSVNVPITELRLMKTSAELPLEQTKPIALVCRHGNDSQEAATKLTNWGFDAFDVEGGLTSWSRIHPEFPRY